jgi:hypothetical protein
VSSADLGTSRQIQKYYQSVAGRKYANRSLYSIDNGLAGSWYAEGQVESEFSASLASLVRYSAVVKILSTGSVDKSVDNGLLDYWKGAEECQTAHIVHFLAILFNYLNINMLEHLFNVLRAIVSASSRFLPPRWPVCA